MTYPPGSPGYSPTPPTTQFSVPTQQLSKLPEPAAEGSSKLPVYLAAAVAVLGLAVYLSSFGPQFTISNSEFPQLGSASGSTLGLGIAVVASVLSGLLAGVTLLPKQKSFGAVVAATSVLAFLLVIGEVINAPSGAKIDWALYLIIAFSLLQAIAAVGWLLLDAGIITAPAPKPKYEQPPQQYNPYSSQGSQGGYYGQQQPQQAILGKDSISSVRSSSVRVTRSSTARADTRAAARTPAASPPSTRSRGLPRRRPASRPTATRSRRANPVTPGPRRPVNNPRNKQHSHSSRLHSNRVRPRHNH